MSKEFLTDAQVEMEIERLKDSPHVKLARKELRIQYKRRQALYQLRNLEKRGKQLEKMGVTIDNIEAELFGGEISVPSATRLYNNLSDE
jgi:chemotaxis receptor (MCP) glutamine deamidase CheD